MLEILDADIAMKKIARKKAEAEAEREGKKKEAKNQRGR